MRSLTTVALAIIAGVAVTGTTLAQQPQKAGKPVVEIRPVAKPVRLAVHVGDGDPRLLNLALNNVQNAIDHYTAKRREIRVEVVAYGPGLTLLRADKSPVADRVASMALAHPGLVFSACQNTITNLRKQEGGDIPILAEARLTPSGVVRLIELQGEGYAYLRP